MIPKKIFSRIGISLFALLMVQQIVVAIISSAITIVNPALMEQGWFMWVLSYLPLYLIAFPVFLGIVSSIPNQEVSISQATRPSVGQMLQLIPMCIATAYILNLLAAALSYLVEMIRGKGITNPLETIMAGSDTWVNLLFVVIIAPIMEEIIFRRILYRKLIGFGPKIYVFFSAFLFAAFHANFYQLAYAFVLGVIFAMLTYYSGTIKYSIILHMIINFSAGGLGSALLALDNEMILGAYSMIMIVLVVVGVILGIRWFRKERQNYILASGPEPAPTKADMFGNVGMILYIVLIFIITLLNILLI